MAKQDLLLELRAGRPLALRQQTTLTLQLSFPAILAQISSIVMQYIDAAMVGQLGRDASAAIGLVASSTWLFGGLCRALVVGISVMVAQRIGAGEEKDARNLVKQGLCAGFAFMKFSAASTASMPSPPPKSRMRSKVLPSVEPSEEARCAPSLAASPMVTRPSACA